MIRRPPRSTLFPTRRSSDLQEILDLIPAWTQVRNVGKRSGQAGISQDQIHALRSEEHTSELQSQSNLVCRLLLEKKKNLGTRGVRMNGSILLVIIDLFTLTM